MLGRSSYSQSAYGQMRDRIKAREEAEKKKVKNRIPYRYLLFTYGE